MSLRGASSFVITRSDSDEVISVWGYGNRVVYPATRPPRSLCSLAVTRGSDAVSQWQKRAQSSLAVTGGGTIATRGARP